MPRQAARPPKKGTAKAQEKAKKDNETGKKGEGLETVFSKLKLEDDGGRVSTGNLVSEVRARDIKIDAFSLALHGRPLVEDTTFEVNNGRRYGLLGRNGCGKSTLLKCVANREIPIPEHFDIYLLAHEAPPGKLSALEYVIDSAKKEVPDPVPNPNPNTYEKNKSQKSQIFSNLEKSRSRFFEIFEI